MGLGFKIISCAAENFGYRPTGTRLGIWIQANRYKVRDLAYDNKGQG
jgi:hypothetical protein